MQAAGIPEEDAVSDAWFLFEEAFGMRRAEYFLKKNEPCSDPEGAARLLRFAEGRCRRIPVQYLTGWQEFMGLRFHVDSRVLIPRGDTEVLVEHVLEDQKQGLIRKGASLLDLCTGSGCIFLSLMKLGDFSRGIGTDLSEDALAVARNNAEDLDLPASEQRISFLKGDLFEALKGRKQGSGLPEGLEGDEGFEDFEGFEGFDVITANPPYIAESERPELMPEVVRYEPQMALFADRNGLEFYERIVREAPKWLKEGGRLYFEIGCTQGNAVAELLRESGAFDPESIRILPDFAGLSRVVSATASGRGPAAEKE